LKSLTLTSLALVSTLLSACAGSPAVERATSASAPPESGAPAFDTQTWGNFHSKRFALSLSLPGARAWKVDDHSKPQLETSHSATKSTLSVSTSIEPMLMNRQRCEERAKALGLVSVDTTRLTTIEDEATVGPAAFDTRVWVALAPGKSDKDPIVGHVYAFGAYIHKCLYFHFSTEVPSARDESALSTRLALVRTRVLGGMNIDDFDEPPRAKP
jgi:hypothetical protein